MINIELINKLIQLRTIIGFLGERTQFNWWDTQFLGETAFGYLELNFPRTRFSAALQSVSEAAKRVHDERIGKGKVNHLFRMTAHYEYQIANYLRITSEDKFLKFLENKEIALGCLPGFINGESPTNQGPIRINGDSFFTVKGLDNVAAYYSHAFASNIKSFPYIVSG